MSKLPPIPPEQRAFGDDTPQADSVPADRRDSKTGLQSSQPGDDDTNLEEQGRQGSISQALTPQRRM
jgi:hypothetical protein